MPLLTTTELANELADRLHVSPATVRRWVMSGKLPWIGGERSKRFDLDAVIAALTYTPKQQKGTEDDCDAGDHAAGGGTT